MPRAMPPCAVPPPRHVPRLHAHPARHDRSMMHYTIPYHPLQERTRLPTAVSRENASRHVLQWPKSAAVPVDCGPRAGWGGLCLRQCSAGSRRTTVNNAQTPAAHQHHRARSSAAGNSSAPWTCWQKVITALHRATRGTRAVTAGALVGVSWSMCGSVQVLNCGGIHAAFLRSGT